MGYGLGARDAPSRTGEGGEVSSLSKSEFVEMARGMFRPVDVPYEGIGIDDAVEVAWLLVKMWEEEK